METENYPPHMIELFKKAKEFDRKNEGYEIEEINPFE